jgi:L-ascorbate metabolism protein UlaG (beta-lactamase superfamily)
LLACASVSRVERPAASVDGTAGRDHRDVAPLALTYLGVAGWQIESGDTTILVDPYVSRPELDGTIVSDPKAVAAHTPAHVTLILVGHSHVDHLLDTPAIAKATGAQIIGTESTTRVAQSLGVAPDQLVPVRGGEDYVFGAISVRVIPSLHSALDDKHTIGGPVTVVPPRVFGDWEEGGTLQYLVRLGGRTVFVSSTANFIEREVTGLRPDIAIIASGNRSPIFDYTCRLLTALGKPPIVFPNHFDNWRGPPVDEAPDEDLRAFVDEVERCAPGTRVVVPSHFARMAM